MKYSLIVIGEGGTDRPLAAVTAAVRWPWVEEAVAPQRGRFVRKTRTELLSGAATRPLSPSYRSRRSTRCASARRLRHSGEAQRHVSCSGSFSGGCEADACTD